MFFETLKRWFGKPTTDGAVDLPVNVRDFWDLPSVRAALRNLERGNFQNAAMMVDAMGRDDRLVGVFNTRIEGLLGLPLDQLPSDLEDPKSVQIAEDLDEVWDEVFPNAALAQLVKWGLYVGLGVGEIIWDREATKWTPRLKIWHPQYVYWRWDTRSYWLITATDVVELTFGDGHWVGYAPFGLHTAYLQGLVRALAQPWLIRNDAYRDWARYSEVHGLPLVKAKIPSTATPQDKREFVMDISGRGNEAVIALPQRDGGVGMAQFDIDLMEAKAESHKAFDLLIARCETSMAITVLGQNLSTEVKGGSFAATKAHVGVKDDLIEADAASLTRCLRNQVLQPWAEYNYGDGDLAPHPKFSTEPVTDRGTTAKAYSDLSAALLQFETAGAPVDQRQVLEDFGIPALPVDVEPTPPPPPAGTPPRPGPSEDPEPEPEPEPEDDDEPPAQSRRWQTEQPAMVH